MNLQSFPSWRMIRWAFFVLIVLGALTAVLPFKARNQIAQAETLTVESGSGLWFADTGQVLGGVFLDFWYDNEELGSPVSPATPVGDITIQWFQYGRLETYPVPYEQATVADVYRAPVGRKYADKIGYVTQVEAFKQRPGGGQRYFPDTGHTLSHGFKAYYEGVQGIPERIGPPISEEFKIGPTTYQFFEFGALTWAEGDPVRLVEIGTLDAELNGMLGVPQPRPLQAVDLNSGDIMEISQSLEGERWIQIDLSDATLTAWVGEVPVLNTSVVIGSPNSPTPIGTFNVYIRYEYQTMSGIGWDGNPYYEADVPAVMYFFEDYAVHGTTWRTDFGIADGQGCVVLPADIARQLYWWADYGTRVEVRE